MAVAEKEEIIYYELVKMEQRITEKAELVLKAEANLQELLNRSEILLNKLISILEQK